MLIKYIMYFSVVQILTYQIFSLTVTVSALCVLFKKSLSTPIFFFLLKALLFYFSHLYVKGSVFTKVEVLTQKGSAFCV